MPVGFALPTAALVDALGDRLAPGIDGFADLFTDDAVLEVPFDGDGDVPPQVGRAAIVRVVDSLRGVLTFEGFEITAMHDVDETTVVYEAQGLLHRADLGRRFRRRYVTVVRLREGRIAHLREHGGPFMPA